MRGSDGLQCKEYKGSHFHFSDENLAQRRGERRETPQKMGFFLSPVTSKAATKGRMKTGHSEILYSYQVS
jgi:hypothetical protein